MPLYLYNFNLNISGGEFDLSNIYTVILMYLVYENSTIAYFLNLIARLFYVILLKLACYIKIPGSNLFHFYNKSATGDGINFS